MGQIVGTGGNDTLQSYADIDVVEGFGGDDLLITYGGGDTLSGGAGNDELQISYESGPPLADTLLDGGDGDDNVEVGWWGPHTLTINGGIGADSISVWGGDLGQLKIFAGDGNDRIEIIDHIHAEITLGEGRDIVGLEYVGRPVASLNQKASLGSGTATILDFTPGAGGDQLDLGWKLAWTKWNGSSNPFTSGFVRLVQDNSDVLVQILSAQSRWTTFVTFKNVDANTLTSENFCGLSPTGAAVTGQHIDGISANDSLTGLYTADTISGNDGADTLRGGPGDDFLDGGAGWDEAAYFSPLGSDASIRTYFADGQFRTRVDPGVSSNLPVRAPEGFDTLVNIEVLRFSGGAARTLASGIQGNHQAAMDGGAFDDVLLQSSSTGAIVYFDMTGSTASGGLKTVLGALPYGWSAVGSADFTDDGRAEAIIQNGNTGAIYFVNIASGASVWGTVSASLTPDWKFAGVGDFTLDGSMDVLVHNTVTGHIFYAEMNGSQFAGWGQVANLGPDWRVAGVGDVDRDGVSDVLVQHKTSGLTYFANVDGGALTGWTPVAGGLGTTWIAKEAVDLNGDGYAEAVFENAATGQVWFVDLQKADNPWGVLANQPGWSVVGAADYDNDGSGEILMRNAADGALAYAGLSGSGAPTWTVISNSLGSDWIAA